MARRKNRKGPIIYVVCTAILLAIALYTTGIEIAHGEERQINKQHQQADSPYIETTDIIQWQWALVCVCFGASVSLVVYIFHTGQNGTRQLIADLKTSTEKGFEGVKRDMQIMGQEKLDVSVHHDCPNFARLIGARKD